MTRDVVTRLLAGGALLLTVGTSMVGGAEIAHATTVRYAGPNGSGSTCSSSDPCALNVAVSGAPAHSEVVVLPGSYGSAAHPVTYSVTTDNADVTITGRSAATAPRIFFGGASQGLDAATTGDDTSWLTIDDTATAGYDALYVTSADHVFAVSSATASTCGVTIDLTDSACVNVNTTGIALEMGIGGYGSETVQSQTIRNVTAVATGIDSVGVYAEGGHNCICSITLADDVIQGGSEDVSGFQESDGVLQMSIAYSSYLADKSSVTAPATFSDDGHNVAKRATFVNLAKGDLREAVGSPTIDKAQNVKGVDTDLAGNPRTVGASTDMGAYEFLPRPTVGTISLTRRAARSVQISTPINPGTLKSTVQLVATRKGSTTRKSKMVSAGAGSTAHAVHLTVANLLPGKKYTLTVVATNRGGTTKKSRTVTTKKLKHHH